MVRMRSPVRIWLSAPKEKRPPDGGASLFKFIVKFELATSNAKHFSIIGQGEALSAGSNLAIFVGDHSARLEKGSRISGRLFLICAPCLLLSKSKPHGRFGPRRQLRPSAVLGFDFVGDAGNDQIILSWNFL